MHSVLIILILVLLAGIAVGLALQHRAYSRLGAEHPKALEILDESSAGILAFQRYLWKRQYLGLGDGSFTQRADWLRRYWISCFVLFLLVLIALVVTISI